MGLLAFKTVYLGRILQSLRYFWTAAVFTGYKLARTRIFKDFDSSLLIFKLNL